MHAQRLSLVSLLLLVMAGCAAQPSALPTATPLVVTTRVPTLVPATTSTLASLPDSVFTSEDMQRRVEQHPAEYKLVIDKDTAVLFAYSHPVGDWVGPIFVVHIPSVSEVVLDWDGKIAFERYGSNVGRKSIGQVLANTELVQRARTRAREIWGRPTVTPHMTPSPSSGVSDYMAGWETFTSSRGYRLKYPPRLLLEKREDGLYVLLQDKNPSSVVFSMDERGLVTLAAMREQASTDFVNPTFTELDKPGAQGFVVEGKLGPGYGEGEYAKSAYIELNDKAIAFGCNLSLCASKLFDQILATLETIP